MTMMNVAKWCVLPAVMLACGTEQPLMVTEDGDSPTSTSSSSGGSGKPGTGAGTADGGSTGDAGMTGGGGRTLSDEQRRAFLRYYAPVILKRSTESSSKSGRDWITNFDFDKDGVFSNNKQNWEALQGYVSGAANPTWTIRPTLYSAMMEFKTGTRRDAIMLFHVYHAKEQYSIHDWERVEMRINGLGDKPGMAEEFRYSSITAHKKHVLRTNTGTNFMQTATGKHLMLWQAQETVTASDLAFGFYMNELHYVEEPWTSLSARAPGNSAKVNINGDSSIAFHYMFIPNGDPAAVAATGAQVLTKANAAQLSASTDNTVSMSSVKKIQYELQDLGDIVPTHWSGNPKVAQHWLTPIVKIKILDGLAAGLDNGAAVPTGVHDFSVGSFDVQSADDAKGYLNKSWFWGHYGYGDGDGVEGVANPDRVAANGDAASLNAHWSQHDYYAHDGDAGPNGADPGRWLPKDWHTPAGDGFDGRWVNLFPND
jgi:hypothetical protein